MSLEQRYSDALRRYCLAPTEEGRQEAYDLGRLATGEHGLNMLEFVELHRRTSDALLSEASDGAQAQERSWEFLLEVLPLYEMKLRGYQEANEGLRQRTEELAAAREQALSASRAKSSFMSSMSHELRTPLNSIIGFSEVMLDGLSGPLNTTQRAHMTLVAQAANHLLSLVDDLLDLGRIEAGRLEVYVEPFDLCSLAEEVVRTLEPQASAKGIPLEFSVKNCPLMMSSDRRMVSQVLLNLLGNAVKFTPSRPGRQPGAVSLECTADESQAKMVVSDHGIGIPSDELPRLFQPFERLDQTSHEAGTGLGLFLCQQFVQRLGGRLGVTSEIDSGSQFTVVLPRRVSA